MALLENADEIIAKSYKRLGDLGLKRARNHEKGFGKSPAQKQLYLQSRIIEVNLGCLLDHLKLDDDGNIESLLRIDEDQVNRFLATLQTFAETDKYATAPTLFHKIKPRVINNGKDGTEIELNNDGTWIQWRYIGEPAWINLVPLSAITGPTGANGADGANGTNGADGDDGREVELQNNGSAIQWRYVGDVSWINLVALSAITGPTGATGANGTNGTNAPEVQFQYSVDGSTGWHSPYSSGDLYFRVSTNGGFSWGPAVLFHFTDAVIPWETTLTYAGSFSSFGSSPIGYRKTVGSSQLQFKGAITVGSNLTPTFSLVQLFTLPVGYRPSVDRVVPITVQSYNITTLQPLVLVLIISSTGVVSVILEAATTATSTYIYFDGIEVVL